MDHSTAPDVAEPASAAPQRRGRDARMAARRIEIPNRVTPYITRNIPPYDILSEESLVRIEATADRILAEIGIEFRDDAEAIAHWRRAGAEVIPTVEGSALVRFPKGLLREILKTAPARFTQHARNPARSVEIGGKSVVFAPAYGSPS